MKTKLTAAEVEQLRLLDAETDDSVARVITLDEARVISETARQEFEQRSAEYAAWKQNYVRLREEGWNWRVACLIAWLACPSDKRSPKTQGELATQVLGLKSDRTIRKWREGNPAIDEAVAVTKALPLTDRLHDAINAMAEVAASPTPQGNKDRRLMFEMAGVYTPKQDVQLSGKAKDLSELTDAELDELASKGKG